MKEKVTLNNKEQKRLSVLNEVMAGRMTAQQLLGMALVVAGILLVQMRIGQRAQPEVDRTLA